MSLTPSGFLQYLRSIDFSSGNDNNSIIASKLIALSIQLPASLICPVAILSVVSFFKFCAIAIMEASLKTIILHSPTSNDVSVVLVFAKYVTPVYIIFGSFPGNYLQK